MAIETSIHPATFLRVHSQGCAMIPPPPREDVMGRYDGRGAVSKSLILSGSEAPGRHRSAFVSSTIAVVNLLCLRGPANRTNIWRN
jgi:hypothetical protein